MISLIKEIEVKKPKRVGRGPGSKRGKTCGRGMSGQKSRSGSSLKLTFEGGQIPFVKKLRKITLKPVNHSTNISLFELQKLLNKTDLELSYKILSDLGFQSNKFYKIYLSKNSKKCNINISKNDKNIKLTKGILNYCNISFNDF